MRLGQSSALTIATGVGIAAALAGCGEGGFGLVTGRLVSVGYSDGEGAIHIARTRDRVLDLECSVAADEFGRLRCLPWTHYGLTYADAECSTPLAAFGSEEAPQFITIDSPEGLGATVYEVGERFEGEVYTKNGDGACQAVRGQPLSSAGGASGGVLNIPGHSPGLFAVQRRITRTEPRLFAAVTPRREPMSDGIDRITYVADDGSEVFGGLEDRRWGRPCSVQSYGDDPVCGPNAYAFIVAYEDAQCSGDDVAISLADFGLSTPVSSAHAWVTLDLCALPELVEVGRTLDEDEAYFRYEPDGTCRSIEDIPVPEQGEIFGINTVVGAKAGRVVDPRAVLPALEWVEEGEGRLVARHAATARSGVVHRNAARFYDREYGFECAPMELERETVCAPRAYSVSRTYFRDAGCEVPVQVVLDTPGTYRHARSQDDGAFYALTDERLDVVYAGAPGACQAVTIGTALHRSCSDWRVVGARVDHDFARLSYGIVNPR